MQYTAPDPQTLAAVDLGSNSFHLIVARTAQGEIQVLDRMKEMVRLGAGLTADGELSSDAQERALACLGRFGQRLRSVPAHRLRVVGTNTLRRARRARQFIGQAEQALGHPIEIISGIEEARLIYLGVSHSMPTVTGNSLVIDIGGGSTELIIGEHFEPKLLESLYMGCVSSSQTYFPNGVIDKTTFRQAQVAAHLELENIAEHYRSIGWERAAGASGTVRAIQRVVQQQGWDNGGISLKALKKLRKALLAAGQTDKLKLAGLTAERMPVFPGGVAILLSAFEALNIDHMQVSDGALREGVVYDLLGRSAHEDARERAVQSMMQRYHVDEVHAAWVERTARQCFEQVAADWQLDEEHGLLLGWAAQLHEVGLSIAHSQFHKHGAYLVAHSDMLGFSRERQEVLAALIRGHRRKFPTEVFDALPAADRRSGRRLCVLLRLAVCLQRSRTHRAAPPVRLQAQDERLQVSFAGNWLQQRQLTQADLQREAAYLAAGGFELSYTPPPEPA